MLVRDPRGQVFEAQLTTNHPASSRGIPVLVVGGILALVPGDFAGWIVAESSEAERAELAEAGFTRAVK